MMKVIVRCFSLVFDVYRRSYYRAGSAVCAVPQINVELGYPSGVFIFGFLFDFVKFAWLRNNAVFLVKFVRRHIVILHV